MVRKAPSREPERGVSSRPHLPPALSPASRSFPWVHFCGRGRLLTHIPFAGFHFPPPICPFPWNTQFSPSPEVTFTVSDVCSLYPSGTVGESQRLVPCLRRDQ